MIKGIKNNYKIINIIMLLFCIYIFCFPLISKILESISPTLTLCPFLATTGKPCPLCGGTRFIAGIPNALITGKIAYILNFFGIVIIIVVLEFIFRIINLFKRNYSNIMINIDIIVHILLIIGLIIYETVYIVNIL